MVELMQHQLDAVNSLDNGKILWGGVGTGKSLTVLQYYVNKEAPRDIIVITTAKKRDSLEWEREAARLGISTDRDATLYGIITIDSWNNITKYIDHVDCFVVFDEQRLVGHGTWVKAFLKIAKRNRWVLLSATPGDTWLDYAPVFIANGLYRNLTEFKLEHIVYAPFSRYPRIVRYLGISTLEKYRNMLLVEMPYLKHTNRIVEDVYLEYDEELYKKAFKDRWHVFEERPITDIAEMIRVVRRIVNADPSRIAEVRALLKKHPRLIIYYNFDYELEILRGLAGEVTVAEWNGHRKNPIPDTESWVYLVQYVAGAEGWNCTATDAMVLYSMTYSFKNYEQALGRIDRLDTPYTDLYYYIFLSKSSIDKAIVRIRETKKIFNERVWAIQNGWV